MQRNRGLSSEPGAEQYELVATDKSYIENTLRTQLRH